jgi:hypothetical protein
MIVAQQDRVEFADVLSREGRALGLHVLHRTVRALVLTRWIEGRVGQKS